MEPSSKRGCSIKQKVYIEHDNRLNSPASATSPVNKTRHVRLSATLSHPNLQKQRKWGKCQIIIGNCFISFNLPYDENAIDCVHRIGKAIVDETGKPIKSIIVKFKSWNARTSFYKARTNFSKKLNNLIFFYRL